MLPATKAVPKEMLPVVDKPLVQYAVEEALAAGIEELIFVTGRSKTAIEDHFDYSLELERTLRDRGNDAWVRAVNAWMPKPGQIAYLRQQAPLGLGHAVWCARNLVGDEPFAVLLADDLFLAESPVLADMAAAWERIGGNLVAVVDVARAETGRFGIVDVAADDGVLVRARDVVEKPDPAVAPSRVSITGRYILEPAVFDHLAGLESGAGGEIQITDALSGLIRAGRNLHGFRFKGTRFDCGHRTDWLRANIAFALARPDLEPDVRQMLDDLRRTNRLGGPKV
jgi:UTP--glucose-1-phosphate uridylyltransferase